VPPYIQKFIAGFLLVVFAFGISPKLGWHNLVADHKDGKTSTAVIDHHETAVSKAAFNCQCDNLISESPFVAANAVAQGLLVIQHPVFFAELPDAPYSPDLYCFGLRGPPAC
jgi:hypothetical protein